MSTPVIVAGVPRFTVVPSPSCPESFEPQHATVPSALAAQV
jgi:hypothetical protein